MDYFDSDYFDSSYFDTPDAGSGSSGGGPGTRGRVRIHVEPPAQVEITDDGWIHILL